MHVTDKTKRPNVFIAKSGTPKELKFSAVKALIDKDKVDDYGDDFVVVEGIRYEPLSVMAWTMFLECHPDNIPV